MSEEPFNASDRSDVKAQATAAKLAERRQQDVVRGLMRGPAGREWMYNLLAFCHMYQTTFTGDALQSAFQEGARNVGLYLQATIHQVASDELILMLKEAHGRTITDDITRRNRRDADANADAYDTSNFIDYAADGPGDDRVDRTE